MKNDIRLSKLCQVLNEFGEYVLCKLQLFTMELYLHKCDFGENSSFINFGHLWKRWQSNESKIMNVRKIKHLETKKILCFKCVNQNYRTLCSPQTVIKVIVRANYFNVLISISVFLLIYGCQHSYLTKLHKIICVAF